MSIYCLDCVLQFFLVCHIFVKFIVLLFVSVSKIIMQKKKKKKKKEKIEITVEVDQEISSVIPKTR